MEALFKDWRMCIIGDLFSISTEKELCFMEYIVNFNHITNTCISVWLHLYSKKSDTCMKFSILYSIFIQVFVIGLCCYATYY